MLLRIVEKRNGEALVLCSDGKYSKCSSKILKKVFEKIEAAQYIAGEIDGWELKYNQMEDYPGITRAYIDDDFILHIYTPNIFAQLLKSESAAAKPKTAESGKSYLTIAEYAKIVGKSPPRIRVLCSEGRFPGAIRKGRV